MLSGTPFEPGCPPSCSSSSSSDHASASSAGGGGGSFSLHTIAVVSQNRRCLSGIMLHALSQSCCRPQQQTRQCQHHHPKYSILSSNTAVERGKAVAANVNLHPRCIHLSSTVCTAAASRSTARMRRRSSRRCSSGLWSLTSRSAEASLPVACRMEARCGHTMMGRLSGQLARRLRGEA